MKILLISGKAKHGKDTAAEFLSDTLKAKNKRVLIAHYGDLVKYVCKTFFNWNGEKDEYGRSLLQKVGTNDIRAVFPNFWVDFIKSILKVFNKEWDYVIIPDTRFPNEIELIKNDFDCKSIRVTRMHYDSGLTNEQLNHPSETALDTYDFDYYLYSKSGIDNLKREVDKLTDELIEGCVND